MIDKENIKKLERVVNFLASHVLNEPKTRFAQKTDDLIDILNLVKKLNMEWIDIKKEIPKELDTILIHNIVSDLSTSIGHFDGKGFNDWVDDEYVKVTHWMKIPKPPKK